MTLDIRINSSHGDFTLNVEAKFHTGVTALFGHSGAGKSTLLHCIAGLIKPGRGVISLDGETLFSSEKNIDIPAHQRKMGIVFQDCLLFPHLSVQRNLEYGQTGEKTTRRHQFETIADLLEIKPLLNRGIDRLSGGEKKRVALARAILGHPRWLLLDEPFSGLDQSLKDPIMMYLRRLHQAIAIPMILVSHCIDEIIDLADEVIFMEKGTLTGQGTLTAGQTHNTGCFCRSQDPKDLQIIKNWLIKNHSLRLENPRGYIRVI